MTLYDCGVIERERRVKVIRAKCKECSKVFKVYGKYDSIIHNCNIHTKKSKLLTTEGNG